MKVIIKAVAALTAVFYVGQANADFMIEPFLGYHMGDYDGGTEKYDFSGTEFGARLGMSMTMFSFGAEYATGTFTVETDPEEDADTTDIGVFVAVDFPVLIRAFATYIVKAESKADGDVSEGNGIRLGIGYTGFPLVSINFEHNTRSYDESEGVSIDVKTSSNGISVSLPLP